MAKSEQYKRNILGLFSQTDLVDGDVIEIGTHTGDTTEIILEYLYNKKSSKHYFGLDTFAGYVDSDMIDANIASINNQKMGRWNTSIDLVATRLKKYENIVRLYEGDSKFTIPNLIESVKITKLSFIYIDCNLHIPSIKAMRDLWPYLSNGGIIAIDEHLVGGETKAITEFANDGGLELKYYSNSEGPSYYIIK